MYLFRLSLAFLLGALSYSCNKGPTGEKNRFDDGSPLDFVPPDESNRWVDILLQSGVVINKLNPGEQLLPNQGLTSTDGRFRAIFQDDSNFVIYYKNRALWASNTSGQNGVQLAFQVDGNAVIYRADNSPVWATGTNNQGGTTLLMNNDGSLTVVGAGQKQLWTSGTCCYPPATPSDTRPMIVGRWGQQVDWPLIAIHSVLMPNSKVFTFGTNAQGVQGAQTIYDIWDPSLGTGANSHTTLPNQSNTDMFCGAPAILPATGDIIIPGGDQRTPADRSNSGITDTLLLGAKTQTLSRAQYLTYGRWYENLTTLPSGESLVFGGVDGNRNVSPTPEIYAVSSGWRSLLGANSPDLYAGGESKWWYPRNWIAPDGRVFGMTGNKMYYLDLSVPAGRMNILAAEVPATARSYISTAVMYQKGKIIQMGGSVGGNIDGRASDGAFEVDINGAQPVISKLNPMAYDRSWPTSTVLPTGEVLVTGGSAYTNQLIEPVLTAEMWNPVTKSFRPLANALTPRLYHSTSLLLADGSVLIAGGGAPGPLTNLNAEIYYPPYLFDAEGKLAPRLQITGANERQDYASIAPMSFSGTGTVARVTLIKSGAVTHSFNMEQRFLELPFTVQGTTVNVTMPANANLATPGYYLLHLIDDKGVPSPAKLIGLGTLNPTRSVLNPGESLPLNGFLLSPDKNGKLLLEASGNLVLIYKGQVLWRSGTAATGAVRVTMQADGNLVLYNANNGAVWSSQTYGANFAGGRLLLQSNGNLVLQRGMEPRYWQSNTCCLNRVRDTLFAGDELMKGEKLKSPDLKAEVALSEDGDLVLSYQGAILWKAGMAGKGGIRAVMQADGNFVLFNAAATPLWASNTNSAANAGARLVLQNDGNFVLYRNDYGASWATNTGGHGQVRSTLSGGETLSRGDSLVSPDKRSVLTMQGDGNLVLYFQGKALWSTNTFRQPAVQASMQADGNFVLYSEVMRPLWSSNTYGTQFAGSQLILKNDGNLVIQKGTAAPFWQSNTCCH